MRKNIPITMLLLLLPMFLYGTDFGVMNKCAEKDELLGGNYYSDCTGAKLISSDFHKSKINIGGFEQGLEAVLSKGPEYIFKDELLVSLHSMKTLGEELNKYVILEDEVIFYLEGGVAIYKKKKFGWLLVVVDY